MGSKSKTLSAYHRRMKRQGIVRIEVHVRRDDGPLVRSVVKALGDPDREREARALLRERFGPARPIKKPRKRIDRSALRAITGGMPMQPESARDFIRRLREEARY
jgi:hypothetical protein